MLAWPGQTDGQPVAYSSSRALKFQVAQGLSHGVVKFLGHPAALAHLGQENEALLVGFGLGRARCSTSYSRARSRA